MELKIKTAELQEMVGKVIKCSSNNKLIPLTSLMSIKVEDNVLTLTTTDATNYFYVSKDKVPCDNFEICVLADLFTRLVQKTTAEETTLIIENGTLKVKGNGTYTMELPLDENSAVIKFPKKYNLEDFTPDVEEIKLSTIKNILNYNKASLAVSIELPSLTCYYCGESVVTSDSYKICSTAIKMFENPRLITAQLMELLGVMPAETIKVSVSNNALLFSTECATIYAPITEGIETFPIEPVTGLVNSPFEASCKVARAAVLNVIDRLSLFVSPYDKKGIYLTFTKDGIMFSSKKSSGTELVPFVASENFAEYTCCIDIEMLRSQISTQESECIELYYGSDIAIKMVDKNITQVVALMEDDRLEA
jgi:hypothetical protein